MSGIYIHRGRRKTEVGITGHFRSTSDTDSSFFIPFHTRTSRICLPWFVFLSKHRYLLISSGNERMESSCETAEHDRRPIESGKIIYMLNLFCINSSVAWRFLVVVNGWSTMCFNDALQC